MSINPDYLEAAVYVTVYWILHVTMTRKLRHNIQELKQITKEALALADRNVGYSGQLGQVLKAIDEAGCDRTIRKVLEVMKAYSVPNEERKPIPKEKATT